MKAVVLGVCLTFILNSNLVFAQITQKNKVIIDPVTHAAKIKATGPDLVIDAITFYPAPAIYHPLGSVVINVRNIGSADAQETKVKLGCLAYNCPDAFYCEEIAREWNTIIDVPALKKGKKIDLDYTPVRTLLWCEGEFTMIADIDYNSSIGELNEDNNVFKKNITLKSSRGNQEGKDIR